MAKVFLRSLILVSFLLLIVPEWGFSYEVRVRVVNGTDEERAAKGLPLTLYILKEEGGGRELLRTFKGESDSQGLATFTLQDGGEESLIGVGTEYRGVTYNSFLSPIVKGKGIYELFFKVFELSDEEGLVNIKERQVFIQGVKDGTLSMMDVITISNEGNKTYVGRFNETSQMAETVRIGLPGGYEQPTLDGPVDMDMIRTMGNGIVLQEMIPPGEMTLFLAYKLRTDIGRFELHYPVSTPYKSFRFFIPEEFGWKTKVRQLQKTRNITIGRIVYKQWEGMDIGMILRSGEKIGADMRDSMGSVLGPRITLKDPSKAAIFGKNELAISVAFILSIVIGILYIRKNTNMVEDGKTPSFPEHRPNNGLSAERVRLLAIVKRLDKEVDGNQETKEFYKPYRTVLIDRIHALQIQKNVGERTKE